MILGHGTSAKNLDDIRKNGIRPRGRRKSKWAVASGADRVYLSDAYAFYFAQNAAKGNQDLLVLEVDVDIADLVPDEDFLGAATAKSNVAELYPNLNERTLFMRDWIMDQPAKKRREFTEESLKYLGNAAYVGTIAPEKITRAALIPSKDVARIVISEFDPIIAPINYRFMGAEHRAFQASLFERYPLDFKVA